MQERFEESIRQALQRVDQSLEQTPRQGHEERFELKLLRLQARTKVKRMPRWPLIALAAAAVVGVIILIVVSEIRRTNSNAEMAKLSDVSNEMAAVEEYYSVKLNADIRDYNSSDKNIQHFLSDIKKLEEEFQKLEETLTRNFNNERIAQAMVNNYKYRLQLMEQLKQYIELQNRINTQINEQKTSS